MQLWDSGDDDDDDGVVKKNEISFNSLGKFVMNNFS